MPTNTVGSTLARIHLDRNNAFTSYNTLALSYGMRRLTSSAKEPKSNWTVSAVAVHHHNDFSCCEDPEMTIAKGLLSLRVACILMSAGIGAEAQPVAADSQAVLVAAAISGAHDLFSAHATRLLGNRADNSTWGSPIVLELARVTGATIVVASEAVRCPSGPTSCWMAHPPKCLRLESRDSKVTPLLSPSRLSRSRTAVAPLVRKGLGVRDCQTRRGMGSDGNPSDICHLTRGPLVPRTRRRTLGLSSRCRRRSLLR